MLAIERKNEILDKLRAEQRVLVSDLAEYYNVTEETIRRDLDKLEKEGYATKTYGGAILGNSTKTDLSYTIRNKTNVDAKNQIAALASRLIEDGDHLMLDDSSTSLYLAKKLKEKKNLTVITNSVELVVELNGIDGWTIIGFVRVPRADKAVDAALREEEDPHPRQQQDRQGLLHRHRPARRLRHRRHQHRPQQALARLLRRPQRRMPLPRKIKQPPPAAAKPLGDLYAFFCRGVITTSPQKGAA